MKVGGSRTAAWVTLWRAIADAGVTNVPDFHDPTARVLLSDKNRARVSKIEARARSGRHGLQISSARVAGDFIALRTKTIDEAVRGAFARGTMQLVILGAGFDGRAWRMRELEGARVFEVDHPATQAVKRARASGLPHAIADVTFVALDFERESLGSALERAGHDATRATCWVWEGVVMYLTREAMRATLSGVASRSADGSALIVNYHTSVRRSLFGLILRVLGEPQRSKWSPEEMAADLHAAGFRVVEDSAMPDWRIRFAPSAPETPPSGRIMRVAVAIRERGQTASNVTP
jgi:methyltransferase (TIGR00027 family)